MHPLLALLIAQAVPAEQPAPAIAPSPPPVVMEPPSAWDPAAAYITTGQDEPGYRAWYGTTALHAIQVKAFNDYLTQWGVGGILPTWQLLRTATAWEHCGAQPFEVPPLAEWPHIVQTLRYVHDYVIPAVGPVEPVSGYRNPALNHCAGGAPESAHMHYSAIDLVPLKPISREKLMHDLCAVHARRGLDYDVGLGFYAFLRFHVDTTKYRRWNMDPAVASQCPPMIRPSDIATVGQPVMAPVTAGATPTTAAPAATAPATTLAPATTTAQPTATPQKTPERGLSR